MPFTIVKQDITTMRVDAVVNAANTELLMGGGVCGAIFNAAGIEELEEACKKLSPIKTGEAVITPAFKMDAKYIIHTAGPIYFEERKKECESQLRSSYMESLKLALNNECKSIAFPLISSGIYGYPKDEALSVATNAIKDFLQDHDISVYLALMDRKIEVDRTLLNDIEGFLNANTREARRISACKMRFSIRSFELKLEIPFNEALLNLIKEKHMSEVEVYKRANLDRKLFSKIRSNSDYSPKKKTVVALAIALKLSLSETNDLLEKAGYILSHSQKFDLIIEYFIVHNNYDIYAINEVLFVNNLPLLGSF